MIKINKLRLRILDNDSITVFVVGNEISYSSKKNLAETVLFHITLLQMWTAWIQLSYIPSYQEVLVV